MSEPAHERIIQASTSGGKPDGSASRWMFSLLVVLLIALLFKVVLLAANAFPFNADEAIVGLMARHILQGNWPVFFYGQAYMGSLDATLVAGAFSLVGVNVGAIRLVQCLLYLGTVWTTMLLGRRFLGSKRAGIVAGLFLAVPTVIVTLYSTVSLGGYGEALLLGNLGLLLVLHIKDHPTRGWAYFLWGLLAGLGFWAFGLTLVYTLPAVVLLGFIIWRLNSGRWQRVLLTFLGLMIGASPWIAQAISQGLGPLISELGGSAMPTESGMSVIGTVLSRLLNLVIFGSSVIVGMRPPWDIRWLAWPLAPVVLAFWGAALLHFVGSLRKQGENIKLQWQLAGMTAFLVLGFVLTPFGGDPSGRYFLPLAVPMALMAADFVVWLRVQSGRRLVYGLIGFVLIFNLWGTLQAVSDQPAGLTTQFDEITWIDHQYDAELIRFLEDHDERFGYSNYWVSYPLAFLSKEEIIFVPRLPYHSDFRYTERDDRYPPYTEVVEGAARVAYITTHHPDLDQHLRDTFADMDVEYSEISIGDYQVFYALSRRVSPQEMGLGETTP